MTPEPLRTVLFDLDGTLLDTAPDLAHALNQVLLNHHLDPLPFETIRPHVSHGARSLIALGFGIGPDDPGYAERHAALLKVYQANLADQTRVFPGMGQVLQAIEDRGLNWGVVTNKPAWLTDPLMTALGLASRAACVVSGDTTDNPKPHPEPLLYACELAGSAPAQCLYVGDAARDIEAGHRAGMPTLAALFGYVGAGDRPEAWGADGLLEHPVDLLAWLPEPVTP